MLLVNVFPGMRQREGKIKEDMNIERKKERKLIHK
jgi:hypothetical protein